MNINCQVAHILSAVLFRCIRMLIEVHSQMLQSVCSCIPMLISGVLL